MVAEILLSTLGRPGVYRANAGAVDVPIQIIIEDAAAVLRTGRLDLLTHRATGTVSSDAPVQRGGEIAVDGSTYAVVSAPVFSTVPGLRDIGLRRIAGPGVQDCEDGHADLQIAALGHEGTVLINGVPVAAIVNRAAEVLDDFGLPLQTLKTVVSVPVAIAETVSQGDPVVIDGETLRVDRLLPDGHGLVQIVVR